MDAALRKKFYIRNSFTPEETVLIENLEPLEDIGVISDVLKVTWILKLKRLHIALQIWFQDIDYVNNKYEIKLNSSGEDLGTIKVHPFQYGIPSDLRFSSVSSPTSFCLTDFGSSQTSSGYFSDHCENILSNQLVF